MTDNTNDSVKESIAELTGLKPLDFKGDSGPNFREWKNVLASHGFTVTHYLQNDKVTGRHIVLYGDAGGYLQATLSDSEKAKSVKPIGLLTITKAAKAGASREA